MNHASSRTVARRPSRWQRRLRVEALEDRRLLSIDLVSTAAPTLIGATANAGSGAASLSFDGRYAAFQSDATNLVAFDTNACGDVFVTDLQTRAVVRASTDSAGLQANGASDQASLSGDGRLVAFRSVATNLAVGDTNALADVFVKDLLGGATIRVSTSSAGAQADGDSSQPSFSRDGRYVAFSSSATNLVAGDTNGKADVFVKDLVSGVTVLVSSAADGTQGDGASSSPAMSADGRYVAFTSAAANLVAGDTNVHGDVFVKDLQTGAVVRASTSSTGAQGNGDSLAASISADGRRVAFMSYADKLVDNDTNISPDIFVKNLDTGVTTRVNTDSTGAQAASSSEQPSMSADGRYVAFRSYATNLVANDANSAVDVFVKDLQTGVTTCASTDSVGKASNGDSYQPVLSGDGLRLAFQTAASNLVASDLNGSRDVVVKNLATQAVQAASVATIPQSGGNGDSNAAAVSADGRYVVFLSAATNLVPGDTNGKVDVFRKDMLTGSVQRASVGTSGTQATKDSTSPSISGDGRYVAFSCMSPVLVPNDSNSQTDVFVKDMVSGELRLASTDSAGGLGNGPSFQPALSADGRYLAFQSAATNLVPGDTNLKADIFVKDLVSGLVVRASVGKSGTQANADAAMPSLSADGRYVAFESDANNLVAGDSNEKTDVFVKDLRSGAIVLASTASGGTQGNYGASNGRLSADGRYVAFDSQASNLVAGDTNRTSDIFVKDLRTGAVVRASTDSRGAEANSWSSSASLSGDGRYVAFASGATNLVADDVNGQTDVFVKDLQSGTTALVSRTLNGALADGGSSSPSIGSDGRFVAFDTSATNFDSQDLSPGEDVYRVSVPATRAPDTIGLYDPSSSSFYLRDTNTTGPADTVFGYGMPEAGWKLLVGDWDGNGTAGVGLYAPESSTFYLTDTYTSGYAEHTFGYGVPEAGWIPLVGDWNGDGRAGVGLYDPQGSMFYLTDTLETGVAEYTFGYGVPGGGWRPIVGDWDGSGHSGVGLYDPQGSMFYLTSKLASGMAERTFGFGMPGAGWQPVVGDWNGDWADGVGLYDPSALSFYLTNSFKSGNADILYGYSQAGAGAVPLVGDWNGDLRDGVGLYSTSASTFFLSDTLRYNQVDTVVGFGQPNSGWQPIVGAWAPGAKAVDQIDLAALARVQLGQGGAMEDFDVAQPTPTALDVAIRSL